MAETWTSRWQKLPKPLQAWHRARKTRILRIIFLWKEKACREWHKASHNPLPYTEAMFYMQLRFLSKISAVPVKLNLISSRNGGWPNPNIVQRTGYPLGLVYVVQALFVGRLLVLASLGFTHSRFDLRRNGMLTVDALVYLIFVLMNIATFAFVRTSFSNRNAMLDTFNSYTAFSQVYARKFYRQKSKINWSSSCFQTLPLRTGAYFRRSTILDLGEKRPLVCMALLAVCQSTLLVPLLAAAVIVYFRNSPIFLVHALNGIIAADGTEASFQVYHLAFLLIDWTWLTVTIFGNIFIVSTGFVPLIGITLAIRSLRYLSQFFVHNAPGIAGVILCTETGKQSV